MALKATNIDSLQGVPAFNNQNFSEKPHFIHVRQRHKLPFGISPSPYVYESIIKSQLKVVEVVKKYFDCPVVLESLYENTKERLPEMVIASKMLFPNGIPSTIEELNSAQKEFLYNEGGVFTLWFLEIIPSIYKGIHKEISNLFDSQIANGNMNSVFFEREKEAMECANEALSLQRSSNQDRSIVLVVFGRQHDFGSLCGEYGFTHETIDTTDDSQVAGSDNGTIKAWDLLSKKTSENPSHLQLVGGTLFSGPDDGTIKAWDICK